MHNIDCRADRQEIRRDRSLDQRGQVSRQGKGHQSGRRHIESESTTRSRTWALLISLEPLGERARTEHSIHVYDKAPTLCGIAQVTYMVGRRDY